MFAYGPGHRPRVITKAVGGRGGVGTMGRGLGPECSPPWPDTNERRVLDGSSKRQQLHCLQLPAITRYQPSDLRK